MCGIVAYNGKKGKSFNLDKIKMLLYWNQERGKDSLGYYTPQIGVIKDVGKAEDLMSKKDFTIPESELFIGHTRSATVGSINKKNAHPFKEGVIVLAMNGTLDNHWDLCREYGLPPNDFAVDSNILAALLNKTGTKDVLGKINGGCAIVFTNTLTNKMYVYRNSGRPLFRGNIDGCMYISSIEISLKVLGCSDVKEFKEDFFYEIVNGEITDTSKVKKIEFKKDVKYIDGNTIELNLYQVNSRELVGLWLTPCSSTYSNIGPNFLMGNAYQVVGISERNAWEIVVINESGKPQTVGKSFFKNEYKIVTVGSYAFTLEELYYNQKVKNGARFCQGGDLVHAIKIKKDGSILVKNMLTLDEATVPPSVLRYAYPNEVEQFKTFYYINDEPVQTSVEISTQNNFPKSFENNDENPNSDELFKIQVENTALLTKDELFDFTIQEIDDKVADISEFSINEKIQSKVSNIKVLIQNFHTKYEKLLKEEKIKENA